jgi:hydrogenase 3 maturation protease
MSPRTWPENLQAWTARQSRTARVVVLGVGNSMRSDDAAGPLVAHRLAKSGLACNPDSFLVIDAGNAPENTTAELRRFAPQLIILIDAAEMGAAPGTIRWIEMEEIDGMSASTHTMPLSMLAKYLVLELGCEVKILGIQPQSTEIGESVNRGVLLAVDEVVDGLVNVIPKIVTFEHQTLN